MPIVILQTLDAFQKVQGFTVSATELPGVEAKHFDADTAVANYVTAATVEIADRKSRGRAAPVADITVAPASVPLLRSPAPTIRPSQIAPAVKGGG